MTTCTATGKGRWTGQNATDCSYARSRLDYLPSALLLDVQKRVPTEREAGQLRGDLATVLDEQFCDWESGCGLCCEGFIGDGACACA